MAAGALGLGAAVGKAKIGKGTLTSQQGQTIKNYKSRANTAMNLGLSALTEHKNGSVWDQLQK